MTYVVTKYIKGNPYLYEVRSVREGDRVRQVFVRYLGRADKPSREDLGIEPVEREVRERPAATAPIKETPDIEPTITYRQGEIVILENPKDKRLKGKRVRIYDPNAVGGKAIAGSFVDKADIHKWSGKVFYYDKGEIQSLETKPAVPVEREIREQPAVAAVSEAVAPTEVKPSITPEVTIPKGVRPDLYVADIEGMMPETAKKIKSVKLSDGSELVIMSDEGDIYGLIEGKEVGFATKLSDTETDLSVTMEYRNKGIGTELMRQFSIENPEHPTGGLTEGGKRVIEKLAEIQPITPTEAVAVEAETPAPIEPAIISTPETAKDFIIKKEPEPLLPSGFKYMVYQSDGTPMYISGATSEEAEGKLKQGHKVASIKLEGEPEVKAEAKEVSEPLPIEPVISELVVKEPEIREITTETEVIPITPVNPYMNMPIERVRRDAPHGVLLAKEALAVREAEAPEVIPVTPKITIPKELSPLIDEAKKYKTFEEFERALFSEEWQREWRYKEGLLGDVATMGFPKATEHVTGGKYIISGRKGIREFWESANAILAAEVGMREITPEPEVTKGEISLIAKYTETKMSPETGLDTEYSTEYRLIGAPENAGAEWMGNEYGIIRVYSKGGVEISRDLLEVGMSEDAVVKALPFETSYKKAEKFGLAKTEYEKYERDLADKEQAKEAGAQAEKAGYERYHQAIRDLGSIKGVKKTNISYFSPVDNEQKTREGFDVGNGVGIVVHEMGKGKEYAVTHINTGLAMGHNWKNRAEAIALAKSVAKITDWSKYSNEKEIPQEIMSKAASLVRGFTQKNLQSIPIEVTQLVTPKPQEVAKPEVKLEPEVADTKTYRVYHYYPDEVTKHDYIDIVGKDKALEHFNKAKTAQSIWEMRGKSLGEEINTRTGEYLFAKTTPPEPVIGELVGAEKPAPEYLYHASRRGDLYKKGIEPSTAGVIKKDPEGAKVFMASDPESAVGAILSEERLKTEQGVPGYPYKGKGEIVVYRVKLPEGDYYQDPRGGDYITKRAIKPEEIVGWKLRGQKFPEPVKSEAKLEPALSISEIPYSKDLDIRNIETLPKGTGAKYLITLKGQGDELIAKQWARVKPASLKPDEVLVSMTPPVTEKLEPTEENLTLKQNITKAVEERPSRISHGYTAKNAFYVTKDNRIIPADEFSKVSKGDDIISVHSHSGENWEEYTREHGQESFQPPNAADFDHLRWLIKQGYGNKLAVIMGDGRYIQVEIPEPAQPRFTRMGIKTLEKLLYPSRGASDKQYLAKLKAVTKEEGWLLTEGDWKD